MSSEFKDQDRPSRRPDGDNSKLASTGDAKKARRKYGLPLRKNLNGTDPHFDVLRAQRLAAPATVYVECFLERIRWKRMPPNSTVRPTDFLMPKANFTRNVRARRTRRFLRLNFIPKTELSRCPTWRGRQTAKHGKKNAFRQVRRPTRLGRAFIPMAREASREIDRLSIGPEGVGNLVFSIADVDFYRMLPTAGYTKGSPTGGSAHRRRRGRYPARDPRQRLLRLQTVSPQRVAAAAKFGSPNQRSAANSRRPEIRRCDFHPGQPAGRGDRLLAQFVDRYDRADLRHRRPADRMAKSAMMGRET